MRARQTSGWRTVAGLALAIVVAPLGTALCIEFALLLTRGPSEVSLADEAGGSLAFLVIALLFGTPIAAVPGLVLGGLAIALARLINTRSPLFYAAAGLVAGTVLAWVDTGRTKSAFTLSDAAPFIIGGCLSALVYWAVAERQTGRSDRKTIDPTA